MKAGGFDCVIGNPPWGGDIDDYLDTLASLLGFDDDKPAHFG
jgi:hypothetical protein